MLVTVQAHDAGFLMAEKRRTTFDAHTRQVIIGYISQGWVVTIWPEED